MTKIEIKKIEKQAARQVTFTKRRGGLFKKAQQLAVLCDADVAAIIFSDAGRLYVNSSSSLKDMLNRYQMSKKKSAEENELELLHRNYSILCTKAARMSNELRQMKGEGLQGLHVEELQILENKMENGLGHVRKMKMAKLMEENEKLKEMVMITQGKSDNAMQEEDALSMGLNLGYFGALLLHES